MATHRKMLELRKRLLSKLSQDVATLLRYGRRAWTKEQSDYVDTYLMLYFYAACDLEHGENIQDFLLGSAGKPQFVLLEKNNRKKSLELARMKLWVIRKPTRQQNSYYSKITLACQTINARLIKKADRDQLLEHWDICERLGGKKINELKAVLRAALHAKATYKATQECNSIREKIASAQLAIEFEKMKLAEKVRFYTDSRIMVPELT